MISRNADERQTFWCRTELSAPVDMAFAELMMDTDTDTKKISTNARRKSRLLLNDEFHELSVQGWVTCIVEGEKWGWKVR